MTASAPRRPAAVAAAPSPAPPATEAIPEPEATSAALATAATAAAPASTSAAGVLRLASRLPEPGHLWIRFAPKAWAGPDRPWLDLATGRLGRSSRSSAPLGGAGTGDGDRLGLGDLLGLAEAPLDDLLYLPPVPERLADWRDAVAERGLAGGTPVLVQLLPGDQTRLPLAPAPGEQGALVVLDLLAALLPGGFLREEGLPELSRPAGGATSALNRRGASGVSEPPGGAELSQAAEPAGSAGAASDAGLAGFAAAVWPLLPGITDDPGLWERACERLAAAGLRCLQALVPAFGAGDRRRLAQGLQDGAFEALFHRRHREPPPERDFARTAHRHGLAPFLARPLPRPPSPRAENRRLAGLLALAAELWLRLGRPVEQAQSLFRAVRWLDATAYDVDALSREGNLAVVTALDPLARRAVAEAAGGGEPGLVGELLAEYLE